MEPVGVGIVVASLLNGLRHGFDIDHVAAIGDIASASGERRRSFFLTFVYVLGHASIVLALGVLAVLLGAQMPPAIAEAMPKVVGATLVMLGLYVIYSLVRYRGRARLVGRWHLLHALFLKARGRPEVVVEHSHEHAHDDLHDHPHEIEPGPTPRGGVLTAQKTHAHAHTHVGVLPEDPLPAYGTAATFGIGVLHGIGAETPTQVLLFATAAGVGTILLGLGVLVAFVGGMLVSNACVAAAFVLGARVGVRLPLVYNTCAAAIALFSIAVGVSYLS